MQKFTINNLSFFFTTMNCDVSFINAGPKSTTEFLSYNVAS